MLVKKLLKTITPNSLDLFHSGNLVSINSIAEKYMPLCIHLTAKTLAQ
jgi:hypothetical protein